MALPEHHRLKHHRDFLNVYRAGLRRSSAHLVLRALKTEPGAIVPLNADRSPVATIPPTQLGITVSLKVSKRAVVRNRIKRRIRAALRSLLPDLEPGWRIVITVRPQLPECGYGQFLQELEQLLVAAEVLHGH